MHPTADARATDQVSDPDESAPQPTTEADRDRLSFGFTDGGRWRINGELDIDAGHRVEAALTEATPDSLFERGDESASWAGALVEMAESSLDAVSSDARRDRYRTWLPVDVTSGDTTTTDGWRVPLSIRERLLCDGVVQPVWERDGVPFSVGPTQRIVPDRTRRLIERRDRGCRVPGCTADRFVEVHHIVHWLHGGATGPWRSRRSAHPASAAQLAPTPRERATGRGIWAGAEWVPVSTGAAQSEELLRLNSPLTGSRNPGSESGESCPELLPSSVFRRWRGLSMTR